MLFIAIIENEIKFVTPQFYLLQSGIDDIGRRVQLLSVGRMYALGAFAIIP